MPDGADWVNYFALNAGRSVHPDFLHAFETAFPGLVAESNSVSLVERRPVAVDLGAGDGTESAFMLVRGLKVFSVDITPGLRSRIIAKFGEDPDEQLTALDSSFGEVTRLPAADFIYAGLSLPFATEEELTHVLTLTRRSLKRGGTFAAHFFGENDSWTTRPDVRTHTRDQLRALVDPLGNVTIEDKEYDGNSGQGPKHWHIRFVTVRTGTRAPDISATRSVPIDPPYELSTDAEPPARR